MPKYEYQCLDCKKKFELYFQFKDYGIAPVHCTHCESDKVQRKIGRIRFARSEESRLENMADPSNLEGLDEDPRALGRMMRQMSNEVGEEMGPEFDEVISRLESGQDPEQIEKELPELGESMSDDMGGMGGADMLDDI
jgi:putative FmdB family regulatory protein